LLRHDNTDVAIVVAGHNSPAPVGSQFPVLRDNMTGEPTSSLAAEVTVTVPVTVEGQVWGVIVVSTPSEPLPAGSEERLAQFAELAAVAIANAENKSKLTASRARVIATADETRRRVQRDVHDGAQQRLVHTIIALKLARDAMRAGDSPTDLLEEALSNAERASKELRDIVRGILPASLTRGGLRSGLESLVADLPLPVEVRVSAPRLSAQIETTAYFIVAEAMTNVAKHARASRATVDVSVVGRTLLIEVRDDGVGGADARRGTGLTGLLDRVEAGNGTLNVDSRPDSGTVVRATLLLDDEPMRTHAQGHA
jgi:signal transduction histidine kinase